MEITVRALTENQEVLNRCRVKDYSDYYIYESGIVYSTKTKRYLKPWKTKNGYYQVRLCNENGMKTFTLHRLVAEHFISNPNSLPQVNHIDGDKSHNYASNLEWTTAQENTQHAYDNGLVNNMDVARKVIQIDKLTNKPIAEYESIMDAERATGARNSHISRCCNKTKGFLSAGGFKWEYKEEE